MDANLLVCLVSVLKTPSLESRRRPWDQRGRNRSRTHKQHSFMSLSHLNSQNKLDWICQKVWTQTCSYLLWVLRQKHNSNFMTLPNIILWQSIHIFLRYFYARASIWIKVLLCLVLFNQQHVLSAYDAAPAFNSRGQDLKCIGTARKVAAKRKMILCLVKRLIYCANLLPECQECWMPGYLCCHGWPLLSHKWWWGKRDVSQSRLFQVF